MRVWYILRHMEQYLQDVYELKARREKGKVLKGKEQEEKEGVQNG